MTMISNATSGLMATQVVMNAISNNVANSDTDGYSRQTVTLSSVVSGGVSVSSVDRETSFYLSQQTWTTTSDVGYYTSYSEYATYLEELMSSDSLDITTSLTTFYSALEAASSSPDDDSLRTAVLTDAEAVCDAVNSLAGYMDELQEQIDSQISSTLSTANDLASQIAALNDKIVALQSSGGDTSSLEDSRDAAITSLSELVDISIVAQDDGSYTISLPQGQTLVSGSSSGALNYSSASGLTLTYGKQTSTVNEDMSGSLGGLLAFSSEVLEPTQEALNELAATIADEFNALQTAGYDLNSSAGTELFSYDSDDAASTLAIADDFSGDDLAFSGSASAGTGDNTNLLSMLDLQGDQEDTYTALVTKLGLISSQASSALTTSTSLQSSLQDSLSSISGVNLDEEAANLVSYQNIYSANSKVLTVADELFDTVLNMF
jgi:flagellar hook-associated protein 1 FlgK